MRKLSFGAVLLLAAIAASVRGQSQNPLPFDFTHTGSSELGLNAPNAVPKRIRYGDKGWQEILFYHGKNGEAAPLVIALGPVDALGWPRYRFNEAGLAFAAVPNMEREPDYARKSLSNYTTAVAKLYAQAEELGIDRSRIVVVGAGFGASMAALMGTEPDLFASAGVPFDSLLGVVSIGGEDFDLARRAAESNVVRDRYKRLYGGDTAGLGTFSPMAHIALPNAPAFLLLASPNDIDSSRESGLMVKALARAGTKATFLPLLEQRKGNRRTLFLAEPAGSGWDVMDFVHRAVVRP